MTEEYIPWVIEQELPRETEMSKQMRKQELNDKLLKAADDGDYMMVCEAIEAGADVNLKDKSGATALMRQCQDACYDSAKLLISAGADVNAKNNKGQTALMLACIKGRYNHSINLLLERGAYINAQDNEGNTALMLAGVNEQVETVKLLLTFEGVDAALKNKQGDTALMMVVHYALADAYADYCNDDVDTQSLDHVKIIKLLENHINKI